MESYYKVIYASNKKDLQDQLNEFQYNDYKLIQMVVNPYQETGTEVFKSYTIDSIYVVMQRED